MTQLLCDQLGALLVAASLQRCNSSGPLQLALDEGFGPEALEQLYVFYAEDFRRFGYLLPSEVEL